MPPPQGITNFRSLLANNLAELHIKITILSLDGLIRPEFQSCILEDAMRMVAEAEAEA